MNESVLRFRVGVVVLAASLITSILVLAFGSRPRFTRPSYTIMVRFPRAPGVEADTPVRKSGIPIGYVSDVELLDDGGVRLTMEIDQKRKLRRSEGCRIGTLSLVTGDATLEFLPRDRGDPSFLVEFDRDGDGQISDAEQDVANTLLKEGDYLDNGQVVRDPFQAIVAAEERIGGAFLAMQDAAVRIARLVDSAKATLDNNDDQFRRLLQKSEVMVDRISSAAEDIHGVLGDEMLQQKIRDSIEKLPGAIDDIQLAAKTAKEKIDQVGTRLDNTFQEVERFIAPFADRGDELANSLVNTLENVDRMFAELEALVEAINRGEGTIGRLVYEDDVYQDLRRAVKRFDDVTRQLKPILSDVRIVTDKAARDPGQFGLRGLLDRRPPGAGMKNGFPTENGTGYFQPFRPASNEKQGGSWSLFPR